MSPIFLAALVYVGMGVMIIVHVPIGVAMAIAGFAGLWAMVGLFPAFSMFGTIPTDVLTDTNLASIPMFLMMGSFAAVAGLSADLYRLFHAFFAHLRGGLAMATIGGCAGFGAISGSSMATGTTFMRVAYPEMAKRGYAPSLASGTIAAGGTLGIIIPPSGLLILYGILTEQFSIALFFGAILPAILTIAFYIVAIAVYVRMRPDQAPSAERTSWPIRWQTLKESWGLVLLVVLVKGGIYAGLFTVIEGAAVGCVTAFLFAVFRRRLSWPAMRRVLTETATTTAMIYIIIVGAFILSTFTALTRVPDIVTEQIKQSGMSPLTVIFCLVGMYIIIGSVFDEVAAMVITLPVVFPLVVGFGYDPIWWGVINIIIIQIGQILPPIGLLVFVLHGMRPEIPLKTMYAGIIPFAIVDFLRLAIIILIPALVTWLPTYMGMQ